MTDLKRPGLTDVTRIPCPECGSPDMVVTDEYLDDPSRLVLGCGDGENGCGYEGDFHREYVEAGGVTEALEYLRRGGHGA